MKARYRGKTVCPDCGGSRLRKDASYVKVAGKTINESVRMPVSELRRFFDTLTLTGQDMKVGARLILEIRQRLGFLDDVGLGYLTLDRLSSTLSGGEKASASISPHLSEVLWLVPYTSSTNRVSDCTLATPADL